jgi:hypothetical protein
MLTKEQAEEATRNLRTSFEDLRLFFNQRGVTSFDTDVCRRNLMLSSFQEKHICDQIKKSYPSVVNDGRTGQADIYIPSLDKEIECKLTSLSKTGGFSLQTDYTTLGVKEKLDYLYTCTNREFDQFAVLYFEGLTIEDFHPPANGSRGRAMMIKHQGFKKMQILFGSVSDRRLANIEKLQKKIKGLSESAVKTRQKAYDSLVYWQNAEPSYNIELRTV